MDSFRDFVRRQRTQLSAQLASAVGAFPVTGTGLTSADARQLAEAVGAILGDDTFLTRLSEQLPLRSEVGSEDKFVATGREIARRLLMEWLDVSTSTEEAV